VGEKIQQMTVLLWLAAMPQVSKDASVEAASIHDFQPHPYHADSTLPILLDRYVAHSSLTKPEPADQVSVHNPLRRP